MNTIKTAVIGILISASAAANATELLAPKHYGAELDRCITQIRTEMNVAADTRLEHRVTEIRKDGSWYRFAIETDGSGVTATSACQANRFSAETRLDMQRGTSEATRLASTGS
jgi:hypothetical protein